MNATVTILESLPGGLRSGLRARYDEAEARRLEAEGLRRA